MSAGNPGIWAYAASRDAGDARHQGLDFGAASPGSPAGYEPPQQPLLFHFFCGLVRGRKQRPAEGPGCRPHARIRVEAVVGPDALHHTYPSQARRCRTGSRAVALLFRWKNPCRGSSFGPWPAGWGPCSACTRLVCDDKYTGGHGVNASSGLRV
jgi:hypothetical protein